MILGVHAQDDVVELVGLDFGVSDTGVPSSEPTRLVQGLPEDTLAAVSASGVGDRAVAGLGGRRRQSGALAESEDPLPELDLDLPEDLRLIFGTDLVVAGFGDVEEPRFGARVVTEDGQRAARIVNDLLTMPELGVQTASARWMTATRSAPTTRRQTRWPPTAVSAAPTHSGRPSPTPTPRAPSATSTSPAVVDQLVAAGRRDRRGGRGVLRGRGPRLQRDGHRRGSRFVLRITTR